MDRSHVRNSFELFGFDFMIDENFRVYLIEANTNPCLEISCPLLAWIIPEVVDNTIQLAIDPLFQPGQFDQDFAKEFTPANGKQKKRSRRIDMLCQIKFDLVFDERVDGKELLEHSQGQFDIVEVHQEEQSEDDDEEDDSEEDKV